MDGPHPSRLLSQIRRKMVVSKPAGIFHGTSPSGHPAKFRRRAPTPWGRPSNTMEFSMIGSVGRSDAGSRSLCRQCRRAGGWGWGL